MAAKSSEIAERVERLQEIEQSGNIVLPERLHTPRHVRPKAY